MRNSVQPGNVIEVAAADAAVVPGQVVVIGAILAVANGSAAAGESYNATRGGVFELPKVGGPHSHRASLFTGMPLLALLPAPAHQLQAISLVPLWPGGMLFLVPPVPWCCCLACLALWWPKQWTALSVLALIALRASAVRSSAIFLTPLPPGRVERHLE